MDRGGLPEKVAYRAWFSLADQARAYFFDPDVLNARLDRTACVTCAAVFGSRKLAVPSLISTDIVNTLPFNAGNRRSRFCCHASRAASIHLLE
jgi:hypothetical protein